MELHIFKAKATNNLNAPDYCFYTEHETISIYKRGEITWEEALQAHKEDCNL